MKVIDLLNEIVNGGKIPNKIKWNNNIFELKIDSIDGHFYYEKSEGMQSFVSMLETMQDLNDEVKLIEDKK